MTEPGETFGVGVDHEPQDHERPEDACDRRKKEGRHDEQGDRHAGENPSFAQADETPGDGAIRGARVLRVHLRVYDAVKGHGGGAGADHGYRDPNEIPKGEGNGGGEHPGVGKRQGEDSMLPFDHLQEHVQLAPCGMGGGASRGGCHTAPTSHRRASWYRRSSRSSPATPGQSPPRATSAWRPRSSSTRK